MGKAGWFAEFEPPVWSTWIAKCGAPLESYRRVRWALEIIVTSAVVAVSKENKAAARFPAYLQAPGL